MSFNEEKEDSSYYLNYESESLLAENDKEKEKYKDKDKDKENDNIDNNKKSEANNIE